MISHKQNMDIPITVAKAIGTKSAEEPPIAVETEGQASSTNGIILVRTRFPFIICCVYSLIF